MGRGNSKIFFGFFAIIFFICPVFLLSQKAEAADDHIVINEIYSNPNTGENEWLELYNPTLSEIDLADYSLKDGGVAAKNLSGTITVAGYFIFETTSGWLNNSAEILSLVHNPTNIVIDIVSYGDWDDGINNPANNAPAPLKGKSISRIPNGADSDIDRDDFQITPITKGEENFLPPPTVYSDLVIINEILPEPANGTENEFIELYNSGEDNIDLSGWRLDDSTSGSEYEVPAGTIILGKSYLVFYKTNSGISLNDSSADGVFLIDPNGEIKSQIIYDKSKRGQSYSAFADNWKWSTTVTPLATNVLTVEIDLPDQQEAITTDISGARDQTDGDIVSVEGIVSVVPGKLSSQYFYIQDNLSGIQIYCYSKDFPSLAAGDKIRVTGEMVTTSGERRIKIFHSSDIQILSTHPPPEPTKTSIGQINENMEGEYIEVFGTVTKTSGSTFYIRGSGEIQISIRSGTGIKKPRMSVGDKVKIAGILSQYGDSYRILPIVQSDVTIISASGLPDSGSDVTYLLVISMFASWIILATQHKRRKI